MKAAEEAAFTAFVGASAPRLLRTAVLMAGDRGVGEDLLQTMYERVARRWGRLDGPPEAYARVVLAHLAIDRRRRRRFVETELPREVAGPGHEDVVAVRQTLLAGLRLLPPRQRAVLVLRYYEDLTEAETARTLGIGVGTVKSSASRGLARLREAVGVVDVEEAS